jgi:phosphotransacetylase/acyl dehydratase
MIDILTENITFSELTIGQSASRTQLITKEDIELVAKVSGDCNPTHVDESYGLEHGGLVAHRALANLLVSGVIANELPGPGTSYISQSMTWSSNYIIRIGDTVKTHVKVISKKISGLSNVVELETICYVDANIVAYGLAIVDAPVEKISRPLVSMPDVRMVRHNALQTLLTTARGYGAAKVAVVFPDDKESLEAAIDAWKEGLIIPILIGNEIKILKIAEANKLDLADLRIIDAKYGTEAAEIAVSLARSKEVQAIMKGSLHTDELMSAVVSKTNGLRTGRRISHCFVMYPPNYHKGLIVTDAAINIEPDLDAKIDIVQNAIDLAIALGISQPKVAILCAVETVNPKMQSTLDAATLCKMADRGQIKGGLLDGPLAFDNAISKEAARIKKITSEVAGDPDILLAPNLEAGNMIAKELTFLADSDAAGIVLGAAVPIILTSRADSIMTRLASCAIGTILAHRQN